MNKRAKQPFYITCLIDFEALDLTTEINVNESESVDVSDNVSYVISSEHSTFLGIEMDC